MASEREFMMRTYYEKVFPFELIAEWLAYGTDKRTPKTEEDDNGDEAAAAANTPFKHREFACVLEINGEETFLRYCSFQNGTEMRKEFARLAPTRIEIGPIYRLPVTRSNQSYNAAMERELIFGLFFMHPHTRSHNRTSCSFFSSAVVVVVVPTNRY